MKTIHVLLLVALAGLVGCATPPSRQPVQVIPSQKPVDDTAPVEPVRPVEPVVQQAPVAPTAPVEPAEPVVPFRTVVAVQAALDRSNFSCNTITGEENDQTRDVLLAWQNVRGLPITGEIDEATLRRVGSLDANFMSYTITDSDHAALTDHPNSWRERAARQKLGYTTILETVAEMFHASEAAIRELNPGAAWPNPPAGTVLEVPRVKPARWVEASQLKISLSKRILQGFDAAGNLVLHFPCSIAKNVEKRPVGELKIVNAASNPMYTFDPAVFPEDEEARNMTVKLAIPPGPNNPVGLAWLSLDKPGYGIHGTAWPEDIGKTESHGCFRLANWNAEKLVKMVKLGTPVLVEE